MRSPRTACFSPQIAQTAEAVYWAFLAARQATVRGIMVRLLNLNDEELMDTRRRVDRAELDFPSSDEILHELADACLVVLGRTRVEIAHETVIQAWPRLHDWLTADQEDLRRGP